MSSEAECGGRVGSVSIHLVTHNNATTIAATVRAALAQDVQCTVRVYDNASSDGTPDVVAGMGVPVTRGATNIGYSAGHNHLLEDGTSDYVLTLNPDLVLEPEFARVMAATLDADSRLGSAAGRLLRVEDLGAPAALLDSTGVLMQRNRRQVLRGENRPLTACRIPAAIFGPDGAAAFYRRAMLDDIRVDGEVFDEDFFMHKEDIDVCWRAQLRGWRSAYVPEARAKHVRTFRPGQRQRGRVDARTRAIAVRNRYLLLVKNDTLGGVLGDLLPILRYEALIWIYIVVREPRSLGALAGVARALPRMLRKRRIIQRERMVPWRLLRPFFRARRPVS